MPVVTWLELSSAGCFYSSGSSSFVLSHWAHFTVPRFVSVYVCVFCIFFILYMCYIIVTRWGEPVVIEA